MSSDRIVRVEMLMLDDRLIAVLVLEAVGWTGIWWGGLWPNKRMGVQRQVNAAK